MGGQRLMVRDEAEIAGVGRKRGRVGGGGDVCVDE